MITAALSLAVFMVVVGVGQMFVITLGPGNVDLSLPANIGLASAVAMKVMDGSDAMIPVEQCYLGWQQSLMLLTQLVKANPHHSTISIRAPANNPAVRLYGRFGFKIVRQSADSVTMQRDVGDIADSA